MHEPIRDEFDVFVTGERDMPVKDMKPIDLENAEVLFDYGSRFKEISKLSEDEDLFTTHYYEDIARAFIELGGIAGETVSDVIALLEHIRSYLGDKYYEGYSNNWLRMHGLKPCRRTMKERRYKPCGKGKRGKLHRA
jgi:hypothetical protein